MEANELSGTCSMAELSGFNDIQSLEDAIEDTDVQNYSAAIANLSEEQLENHSLVKALESQGFKKVGTYAGNDGLVTVFLKGVSLTGRR